MYVCIHISVSIYVSVSVPVIPSRYIHNISLLSPFLSVRFSGIKYIPIVVQPLPSSIPSWVFILLFL